MKQETQDLWRAILSLADILDVALCYWPLDDDVSQDMEERLHSVFRSVPGEYRLLWALANDPGHKWHVPEHRDGADDNDT